MNRYRKKKGKVKKPAFRVWEQESPRMRRSVSAGSMFSRLFEHLGIENRVHEQKAVLKWEEIVGETIAAVTKPVSVRQGILKVSVLDPVWRQELDFLKQDICRKLNAGLGTIVVKDIKFL